MTGVDGTDGLCASFVAFLQEFEAVDAYRHAPESRDPQLIAQAWAGLRTALCRQRDLEAAIATYTAAHQEDPAATARAVREAQHQATALVQQAVLRKWRRSVASVWDSPPVRRAPRPTPPVYDATARGVIHRRRAGHHPPDLETIELAAYQAEPASVTVGTRKHDAHWRDEHTAHLQHVLRAAHGAQ